MNNLQKELDQNYKDAETAYEDSVRLNKPENEQMEAMRHLLDAARKRHEKLKNYMQEYEAYKINLRAFAKEHHLKEKQSEK